MEKSRKKNRRDTVLSLVFAVALFCFILTFFLRFLIKKVPTQGLVS